MSAQVIHINQHRAAYQERKEAVETIIDLDAALYAAAANVAVARMTSRVLLERPSSSEADCKYAEARLIDAVKVHSAVKTRLETLIILKDEFERIAASIVDDLQGE